jgi:pectinesterase
VTWTGSASRPQLTDDAGRCYTARNSLAAAGTIGALVTDGWDPTPGLGSASAFQPAFTVATDGSGTHTSVQAAIAAAKARGGGARIYILVKPGTYRAPVCVDLSTPLTLYGADPDATKVTIAFDNYNGKPVGTSNPCSPASGTFGTTSSSTFFVKANDFQAMNLSIANDLVEAGSGTAQAVAMTTTGDRLVFQNVRLLGNQDTLQAGTPDIGVVARSYYKACSIEGDTDFIFGKGTAVFDDCTITYTGLRKNGGTHLAPSTNKGHPFGFLLVNSRIAAGPGAAAGKNGLARSWSEKASSNGQAVIRNSRIDGHIDVVAPYRTATGSAIDPPPVFNPDISRFFEYENTGAGAAH